MKKLILVSLFIFILSLTACSEVVHTETKEVDVKIVDVYHQGMSLYRVGGITMYNPSIYDVTIEYHDKTYTFDDQDLYEKYKDKIGKTTKAVLVIYTYDNGDINENITELK